jgi:sugar lactone lactonase YvrE
MLTAVNAWAVTSSLWETGTTDEFEAGEPQSVSVIPPGQVVLGPRANSTMLDALYAWTLTSDSHDTVFVGTGNDGKIFRITSKGEAEVFVDLDLQQVFALAIDKNDTLYAAGFPGGKVLAISRDGEITEYFDTGQDSVWALCFGADGALYAATGDEGQLFKIEAAGKGELLYDSSERRILSLVSDNEGNLYAGSEQNGIIFRIDRDGHPFVLYDTELEEITSMTLDADNNLYAVSSPGELFMKIPPRAVPTMPKAGGESAAAMEAMAAMLPSIPGPPAIPSPKDRTCILYKITPEGTATKLWTSPKKLVFSVLSDGADIIAGSGDEGIVYRISPRGEAALHYQADQKQVLGLHRTRSGRIVASLGNEAALIAFDNGYASEGAILSSVHDATAVSQWGRLFCEAEIPSQTRLSFATRSGNSTKPGDTWSEWSREHNASEGFTVESPRARSIQWRATFSTSNPTETPILHKVTVAYLQSNLRPEITSISVDNSEGKQESPAAAAKASAANGSAMPVIPGMPQLPAPKTNSQTKSAPATHNTKAQIAWQAQDENKDTLEYELYFKGTEEKRWKLIKDRLTDAKYEWDTESVPDGEYHIKVVATDRPGNPEESSLSAERISEAFVVDNTAPVVSSLRAAPAAEAGAYRVTGAVSDNLSPVRSAEYSIDAGPWATVFPDDGIFDARNEKIEFTLDSLDSGEHTVVLRAVDYHGNIGAGKITFESK